MTSHVQSIVRANDPGAKVVSAPVLPRASSGGMRRAEAYLRALAAYSWPIDVHAAHVQDAPLDTLEQERREADRIAILNEFGVERNLIQDDAQILIDLAGNNQIEETSTEEIAWIGENTAAHAQKIRDDLLERAAMSLLKYAALASAQGKLEADIVEMHGYAVKQLLDLAGKDLNLSNQVVDSLERAVTKRTRLRSVA
jgi:hypothetical protein